jgi:cyclic-di-GMP phosphodiesterase TipF (flagellum assembly factor)
MQNLIEQLAGQLDQEPVQPEEAAQKILEAPAAGTPAGSAPSRVQKASSSASALPRSVPARAVHGAAPEREAAPFGHIALLAEAVEAKRMDVLLDPILGLSDRRARHFELSVRLLTEKGDSLGEEQYGPAAAGTGLLGRIDAEKLARAADVLQRLRARGSAASLFSTVAGESLSDDNFASVFADVLEAEDDNASRLVLTFRQAEARNFTDAHWRAVSDMSRIGLKFALTAVTDLDMDFEALRRHGFDFVKLDARVFLEGLPTPTGVVPAADICRHMAGIGLGLIVGGIVEEKDLARILGFGVLLGQGALFGGPRSVELERERRAA